MLAYNFKIKEEKIVSIELILNSKIVKINSTDFMFEEVYRILCNSESEEEIEEQLLEIFKPEESLTTLVKDRLFYITDTIVFKNGDNRYEFKSQKFLEKIKRLFANGVNLKYVANFCEKLTENPSEASQNMIFDFLEHNDIAIATDGDILGYKSVMLDLYDAHSHTIQYNVGTFITMDRNLVDIDPNNHCSSGLHVGSYIYANGFSQQMLLVKLSPADVVSVPNDHSAMKLRCCKMFVVSKMDSPVALEEACYSVKNSDEEYDGDDDDNDCEDKYEDEYEDEYEDKYEDEDEDEYSDEDEVLPQTSYKLHIVKVTREPVNSTSQKLLKKTIVLASVCDKPLRDPLTGRFAKRAQ